MSLKTIDSAPKDGRYILLFGPSGYLATPRRCEAAHWRSLRPDGGFWENHAGDHFTDDGAPPTHWCEIPTEEDNSSMGLLSLVADIRAAVGDPTGKLMQDELVDRCRKLKEAAEKGAGSTADDIIQKLEAQGLGWDIGHAGSLIEVRIWKWPYVLARYRPHAVAPLAQMLAEAVQLMPTGPGAIRGDVTPSSTTPPNPYP